MSALDWLHFLGLIYVVFGLAAVFNPNAIKGALDELPLNKAAMFSLSFISLVLGAAILTTHHGWGTIEDVAVSLIGWAGLLKGLVYLTNPHAIDRFKPMVSDNHKVRALGFFSVIFGACLLAITTTWL